MRTTGRNIDRLAISESEREKAEIALEKSEKHYRELWDNAPIAYHTLDTKGIITGVNKTEAKMLGYSRREMLEKSIFNFILPEQRAEARQRFKLKISGKRLPRAEDRVYVRKDGSKLHVMIDDVLERSKGGDIIGVRTTMVDISDLKRMEEALKESQERYRALFDRSLYGVYVHDFKGQFLDANKAALNLLGYKEEDIPSINLSDLLDQEQLEKAMMFIEELKKKGTQKEPHVFKLRAKDGRHVWVETEASVLYREGKPYAIHGIAKGITESIETNEALRESKEKYRILAENAMDGIYVISPHGFEYVNPAFERLFGYKTAEVCNRNFNFMSIIHPEDRKLVLEREEARKKGKRLPPRYSFRVITKGGRIRYVEANTVSLSGEKVRVLGILRDITEQKHTEEALRESEEKHRTLVEQASDGIIIIQDDTFKYANKRVEEMSGYAIEELIGSPTSSIISIEDNPKLSEYYNNRKAGKKLPPVYELPIKHKDGHDLFIEFNTVSITYQGKPANMVIIRDITERKRAEEAIAESKQRYKDLVEKAGVAILIDDFEAKLKYCNKKYAEMFGYTMEEIKEQSIETLVYPDDVPMVRRYHRGRVRGKNVPSKYECRGLRKDGSVINIEVNAVPLKENGGIVGTRCYIWDITDRKQAEEEKQNIYEKLRKALEETVNALSSAVETRDPYTAGHQQRVANLASAIAREMKLSEAQIEGIRMAGVVHDVGKIRVPAEILSKPGKIDDIDFSIIKSHPQIGFNILRKIEFPYLVGQIILQHHERLNGSGYPVGLSGEKILLEARILAVADVVEAMASHRPYRPALGVDKALKEISRNKGILYDPQVVDTCLKLFQQKKFRFE